MRAYEFITESVDPTDYQSGLERAKGPLPSTYVIPELSNQDFYEIYRFGLALAAVRGEQDNSDGVKNKYQQKFEAESKWGEHQIVSSFDPNIDKVIDKALAKINKSGKTLVSTKKSEEPKDTNIKSTIKPFKGYAK